MGWGGTNGKSAVPLNYAALDEALVATAANTRMRKDNRGKAFLYQRYVYAHRKDDDIALRLYNTDIAIFHRDDTITLYGAGWLGNSTTQHWIWNITGAGLRTLRFNRWTWPQHTLHGSVFYDGIRTRRGHDAGLLSECKAPVVYTPSAEAKLLRRQLTKLGKVYRAFAIMHETNPSVIGSDWYLGYRRPGFLEFADKVVTCARDAAHEFDLEVYTKLHRFGGMEPSVACIHAALAKVYEHHVKALGLFDITEVTQ